MVGKEISANIKKTAKLIKNSEIYGYLEKLKIENKNSITFFLQQAKDFEPILFYYKNKKNKVEFHNFDDDVYFIIDGKCLLTTGGEIINPEILDNNNRVGDSISGGQTKTIQKGDIVIIPKKTPHMLDVRRSSVGYLLIKIKRERN